MSHIRIKASNFIKGQLVAMFGKNFILTTTTFGTRKFNCANRTELSRTINYGGELQALGAFLFLLKKEDVVWDIGSSVGLFTVYTAGIVEKVVAFEPDPEIFKRLESNIRLNNFTNVIANQIGVGEEDGEMNLNSDGVDGFSPSLMDLNRHNKSISVQVKSSDSLIQSGLPVPTVMKIDIEGAEGLALKGAHDLLKSPKKPRLLFIEMHPKFLDEGGQNEIMDILKKNGYKILNTQKRDQEYHLIATV